MARQQEEETQREAEMLLGRTLNHGVDEWAARQNGGRDRLDSWITLGNVYKSALVLFAASSLSMAPRDEAKTRQFASAQAHHASLLAAKSERAVQEPEPFRMALCWPTIALGVAASESKPEGLSHDRDKVSPETLGRSRKGPPSESQQDPAAILGDWEDVLERLLRSVSCLFHGNLAKRTTEVQS